MRFIVMALSFALLASNQAYANDCEAKAAQIVSKLGATIERRSSFIIFLKHDAVPDGFTIGCGGPPSNGPDVYISWGTNHPSESYWSVASSVGAILTGASQKVIEAGARACYAEAEKTPPSADMAQQTVLTRGDIMYECTLMKPGPPQARGYEGAFNVDIYRHDAAKQAEMERHLDETMARIKAGNKAEAK
jgi:hypothetical protein